MSFSGSTVGWILIIEGLGTSSGLTVLSSFTPSSSLKSAFSSEVGEAIDTAYEVLPSRIAIGAASLEPFAPLSSDAGFSIRISANNTIRSLLDYENPTEWSDSGETVRCIEFVNNTDTAIIVTDNAAFSANDLIYYDGEVMEVTSTSSTDTVNVNRGALATNAIDHPQISTGGVLWQQWPKMEGVRAYLYWGPTDATAIGDGTDEFKLRFRGVLQGIVTDDGPWMTLQIGSLFERLKGSKFRFQYPIQFSDIGGDANSVPVVRAQTEINGPLGAFRFSVDETWAGSDTWTHVYVQDTDEKWWTTHAVTQVGSLYEFTDPRSGITRQLQDYTIDPEILAAGLGQAPCAWQPGQDDLAREFPVGETGTAVIRRAFVISGGFRAPELVLTTILIGASLGGLDSDDLDTASFTAISEALGVSLLNNMFGSTAGFVVPPTDRTYIEWIRDEILIPLGLALVVRSDGKFAIISWRDSYFSDGYSISDDTAHPRWTSPRTSDHVLREITLTNDAGDGPHTISSDRANQQNGGGDELEIAVNALRPYIGNVWDHWVTTMLGARERARRIGTFTLRQTGANSIDGVEVGSVAAITLAEFPVEGGTRPDPLPQNQAGAGFGVTTDGRSGRLIGISQGADIERSVRCLVGPELGNGAIYAPAGVVDGVSATTTIPIAASTISVTGDDPDSFAPYIGHNVILTDDNGTRLSTNAPELLSVVSGVSITVDARFNDGADITTAVGQMVIPAPLDEQDSSIRTATATKDYGWLASQAGALDAGSAQRYE